MRARERNHEAEHEPLAHDSLVLAELVDEVAERLQRGESVDIDQYLALHPELDEALRAAFESLVGMREFLEQDDAEASTAEPKQLGDYRLLREIGRGGMGVVYEALQLSLGRRVALKVLPFAALWDQRQLERFKNEARAAAMLKHPHIVSVHAVGCERGAHFYAMELVDGMSLADVIGELRAAGQEKEAERTVAAAGPDAADTDTSPVAALSTQRRQHRQDFYRSVARLGIQAAEALHAAHQEGVIHRDIKPSNLLIDHDGKLWITDFGLARIQTGDKLTMTGDLVGTLRYMSPEQADPQRGIMDHRTDIYSLGISLYELLTLQPALSSDDRQRLLKEIDDREPAAPRSCDSNIPRDLETIILKAAAKEASDRYATAADLAGDFRRFLDDRPITARRSSRLRNAWRWARRNPALATVSTTALCLLTVLAIAGPWAAFHQAQLSQARLHDLYAAEMQQAYTAYKRSDFLLVDEKLRRYLADDLQHLRGFEWYALWQNTRRQFEAPHKRLFYGAIDVAPDGRSFAAGSWFGTVSCCDALTMERIWRAGGRSSEGPGHEDDVLALAHSSDGKIFASGGRDKVVKLWDTRTGDLLLETEPFPQAVSALDISVDNALAIGFKVHALRGLPAEDTVPVDVLLFDIQRNGDAVSLVERGAPLEGCTNVVRSLSFSPDGTLLAAGADGSESVLWGVADQQRQTGFDHGQGSVLDVDFSPDGSHLASVSGIFDGRWIAGQVAVVEVASARSVWKKRVVPARLTSVAYSVTGDLLATGGGDGRVRIWSAESGQLIETIAAHGHVVTDVDFAGPPDVLYTTGHDKAVRRWNIEPDAPATILRGHARDVLNVDFSADSRWLASSSGDEVINIWDVETGRLWKQLNTPAEQFNVVRFAPNSQQLLIGGGPFPIDAQATAPASLWDIRSDTRRQQFRGLRGKTWRASFSPDGKRLLTSGYEQQPTIWNVQSGELTAELELPADFFTIDAQFSPDGQHVVACAQSTPGSVTDGVFVWDAPDWQRRERIDLTEVGDHGAPYCMAFSRDGGRLAVGGWGDVITLWSLPDARHLGTLAGHRQTVLALDFTPDGRRLASGSCDKTVRIWDLETRREVMTLRELPDWVWTLKFSPDGRTLAIGSSADGGQDNLILWRAATEEEVQASVTSLQR